MNTFIILLTTLSNNTFIYKMELIKQKKIHITNKNKTISTIGGKNLYNKKKDGDKSMIILNSIWWKRFLMLSFIP